MERRSFISSCVAGAVTGGLAATMENAAPLAAAQPGAAERALGALRAARQLEASGNLDRLRTAYHTDALIVDPAALGPVLGRAAITETLRRNAAQRRLVYFYYRQPQVRVIGNSALVVSNYEAGYTVGGKTIEDTGKTTNVVLVGPTPPIIAQEVVVPNIHAGSYGALGTALARPRFGIFPLRALGQPPLEPARSAGGGENDVLFGLVRQINAAWVSGNANDLLRLASRNGVFLVGDYSPFYIAGMDEVREHFADFYKSSRVNALRELSPMVRIWGDTAAVAFTFDLDYLIGGVAKRAPGRAVYTFTRDGIGGRRWAMAACAASHLVEREIGDPYPLPA